MNLKKKKNETYTDHAVRLENYYSKLPISEWDLEDLLWVNDAYRDACANWGYCGGNILYDKYANFVRENKNKKLFK